MKPTQRGAAGPLPCASCPWRAAMRDARAIPGYDHDRAVALLNTAPGPDAAPMDRDGFRPIMACHGPAPDAHRACLGYLAQAGDSNLNVRVAAALGRMPYPHTVRAACARRGVALEPDYPAVLDKLARSLEEPPADE